MFKFLKDKLKQTVNLFSKNIEEESNEINSDVEKNEKFTEITQKNITDSSNVKLEEEISSLNKNKNLEEETTKKNFNVLRTESDVEKDEKNYQTELSNKQKTSKLDAPNLKEIQKNKTKDVVEKETTKFSSGDIDSLIDSSKIEKNNFGQKTPESEKDEEIKKTGFFEKLLSKKLDENKFEDLFWELEITLLENNISVKVIDKIKQDLKDVLINKNIKMGQTLNLITETLKKSLQDILNFEKMDLMKRIESKKPFVICFFGINGSGKTTSIAKFAKMLQNKKKSLVLAAADTFRAAAIDQLQEHANNLNVKLIKHDYGSDPAAVAFDAIKHAESKKIDVVLIDTAGRLHSNSNLIEEMKKIVRVSKPDLKIFVGESITGNDCVEQAEKFNESIGIDGIILSKADVDEKGGASISIGYITKKPILFFGVGQNYEDFEEFDANKIISKLDF